MSISPDIVVVADAQALAREAADRFLDTSARSISEHGAFFVALSGGSTPRALFELLASGEYRNRIDWPACHVFFSDERFVPPESSESNYHTAREALLSRVAVREDHIHRVPTVGVSPEEAALQYERVIRNECSPGADGVPVFDLILLGLGPDGHTASLFPGTSGLTVRDRLVISNYVPRLNAWRITFTYTLINAATMVAFLVQGQDKAERVDEILSRTADLPAAGIDPSGGKLVWLLDAAAASMYRPPSPDSE